VREADPAVNQVDDAGARRRNQRRLATLDGGLNQAHLGVREGRGGGKRAAWQLFKRGQSVVHQSLEGHGQALAALERQAAGEQSAAELEREKGVPA
jgi:hypothetical protein